MAHKYYIGVDNGVSGSIGIVLWDGCYSFSHTPVKKELSYTKEKQWISRVDYSALMELLTAPKDDVFVAIERPMINPMRFKASMSACRSLEATLLAVEAKGFPYIYLDSKEWQKAMLPSGLEGDELKKASLDIGKRTFPNIDWKKFKDADGLLIAEYCKRKGL